MSIIASSVIETIYDLSLVADKIRTRTSQDKVETKPVHLY